MPRLKVSNEWIEESDEPLEDFASGWEPWYCISLHGSGFNDAKLYSAEEIVKGFRRLGYTPRRGMNERGIPCIQGEDVTFIPLDDKNRLDREEELLQKRMR